MSHLEKFKLINKIQISKQKFIKKLIYYKNSHSLEITRLFDVAVRTVTAVGVPTGCDVFGATDYDGASASAAGGCGDGGAAAGDCGGAGCATGGGVAPGCGRGVTGCDGATDWRDRRDTYRQQGGRVTKAVGTLFRKIFVGTRHRHLK